MNTPEIKFKTKADIALEVIKNMIVDGNLEQGRKYSFTEIANMLNISRTPVAKAIVILEQQGLVKICENSGFEIKKLDWNEMVEHFYMHTQITKLVVKWAIERCPDEVIKKLGEMSKKIRDMVESGDEEEYFNLSQKFHQYFCEIVEAKKCLQFLQNGWDFEGLYSYNFEKNKGKLLILCDDHDKLIEAMLERDLAKAEEICDEHTVNCLNLLKDNFKKEDNMI